jgi:hypothetical protein
MKHDGFMSGIENANSIITAIDSAVKFPESVDLNSKNYGEHIDLFCTMIRDSDSSEELLEKIRSNKIESSVRMSLLKMFRRCVSTVLDTEATKKILKITTASLVSDYGHTFKPISILQSQFNNLTKENRSALSALLGEYDTRGQSGYILTGIFFEWFESNLSRDFSIEGPRGAGRDIELDTIFPQYEGKYPCDFVIRSKTTKKPLAIGFARYDSTRGGAQSDDRTGGNANKVSKAKEFCEKTGESIRIIFLSDGPGLSHRDTWHETCVLDRSWDDNVRVTTLKTANTRVTREWLLSPNRSI